MCQFVAIGAEFIDNVPVGIVNTAVGVNRETTITTVAELRAMGAGGAVCFAAGFLEAEAELGDGAAMQARLLEAAGDMPIIGPNCYIRGTTSIGRNCRIGNGVEIKNCIIMDNSKVPHLSYIGDSVIGEHCNIAAGTSHAT